MDHIRIIYEYNDAAWKLIEQGKLSQCPFYQHDGTDAGFDIRACIEKPIIIPNGFTQIIPTGIHMHPEYPNWEIQVRSRSGLAAKGIFVTNGPGTIDYAYRAEVKIILTNLSGTEFMVNPGDRIAQICPRPIPVVVFEEGSVIADSENRGGFGSSGIE